MTAPSLNLAPAALRQELAALVREETQDGRATVRFLVDLMQGSLEGFKPQHRLGAAKELLRRGFDSPENAEADEAEDALDTCPEAEAQAQVPAINEVTALRGRYASYPAGYNRYQQEPGPFDAVFDNYDKEDFYFDCYGAYARRYVLGGAGAASAAAKAVFAYRCRLPSDPKCNTEPDPDWEPDWEAYPESLPAGCPLPQDIYGFRALTWAYNSAAAARVAAQAAAEYHRLQDALAGRYSDPPDDSPPPPDHPPPEPEGDLEPELEPELEWEPEPEPPRPTALEEMRARRRREEDADYDRYAPPSYSYSSITIPLLP